MMGQVRRQQINITHVRDVLDKANHLAATRPDRHPPQPEGLGVFLGTCLENKSPEIPLLLVALVALGELLIAER